MKSSLKISVMAVGIISAVLISAAASPASGKIVSVNKLTGSTQIMQETYADDSENITMAENTYELLEVNDETIKPSEVKAPQTVASQKPAGASSSMNSQKATSTASKPAASQQAASASAVSSLPAQSTAAQSAAVQSAVLGSFLPVSQEPTPLPHVVDGGTTQATHRDANGGEVLAVNGLMLPVKEALKRIVSNEMNASMNYEAIKAQVVSAHTYVKYYNESGSSPSLGMQGSYKAGGLIDRAVEEVYNIVMTCGGKAIYSPYCSMSCGSTQASKEVWGGTRSYLVAAESKYDVLGPKYESSKTFSTETARSKIKSGLGIEPSGDPSTWFEFLGADNGGYTSGGYVNKIIIAGKKTTGTKVRTMFNLRSACFIVKYNNGNFTFVTHGYGHGVGLSQWGAHYYAVKDGWDYRQIVSHYFTGVALTKVV